MCAKLGSNRLNTVVFRASYMLPILRQFSWLKSSKTRGGDLPPPWRIQNIFIVNIFFSRNSANWLQGVFVNKRSYYYYHVTIIFVQILSKNSSREDRVKKTILVLPKMWTLNVKPWPNGLASRRKLKTWGYLRHRLARACMHLRWLAMTCDHFGRDQICTQVKASFSPFGHPIQVNASWVTSINLLLANGIEDSLP